jgi:hypothetical protein
VLREEHKENDSPRRPAAGERRPRPHVGISVGRHFSWFIIAALIIGLLQGRPEL